MTPANKGIRYPKEVLEAEEVWRLLAQCGPSARGQRNRALLTLLWRTGMRVGESLALRREDLNLGEHTVRILRPKGFALGKQPRVLGLDPIAREALTPWLEVRAGMVLEPGSALFVSQTGKKLDTSYVRRLLPALASQAGIARRVHPHILRHSFAFECAMEGRPIPWISAALGHTELQTTALYLKHLAPADVISGMKERT